MSNQTKAITINQEDAFQFIVRCLREKPTGSYSNYGYELYLPKLMGYYLEEVKSLAYPETDRNLPEISGSFYAAAWELCRRGIIRPGIARYNNQVTDDGSGGNGYSLTPAGQKWLQQAGQYDYVPTEPGRFAQLLDNLAPRFGPGFRERSQEALRCYNALAYLACCAMCGAAAESIILALAIAKDGDEAKILKTYEAVGGRGRIESLIIGKKDKPIKNEFQSSSNLLKYWRDIAAHGKQAGITENEAFTSLALLLRFAQFANERWTDLTQTP